MKVHFEISRLRDVISRLGASKGTVQIALIDKVFVGLREMAEGAEVAASSASDENYLPGAASMIEEIDKKVLIILRDGRHLVGKLRSFDQFMNLILEDTHERLLLPGKYSDVPVGLFIVRGDTIVLMGEVDSDPDAEADSMKLERVDPEAIDEEEGGPLDGKLSWDFE